MHKLIYFYMTTLNLAKTNKVYTIVGYKNDDAILRRFLELGFSLGQKVKVVSSSLQKKVVLVEVRGYLLSVRAALLERILVE